MHSHSSTVSPSDEGEDTHHTPSLSNENNARNARSAKGDGKVCTTSPAVHSLDSRNRSILCDDVRQIRPIPDLRLRLRPQSHSGTPGPAAQGEREKLARLGAGRGNGEDTTLNHPPQLQEDIKNIR